MGQMRNIFLVLILCAGISVSSYAQDKNPPEPTLENKSHDGPPCDEDEDGSGTPPPPGLCLPIDDYVYLLMAVGAMYGCYKLRKFELA